MRRVAGVLAAWALAAWALGGDAAPAHAQPIPAPRVTGVEWVSPTRLPEEMVRAAIGQMVGRPRSRAAIRDSLGRLWALGFFSRVWVDEVAEPGGVRLRYHLERRPYVRRITWRGDAGLSAAEAAAGAGLAVGGDATLERLERARRDLLAWYAGEGFMGAEVRVTAEADPATGARDVTVYLEAGDRTRIGAIRIHGATTPKAEELAEALGLEAGDRYREAEMRRAVRGLEERLRKDAFFTASAVLREPVWDPATNRVALDVDVDQGPKVRVEFSGQQAVKEVLLRERLTFGGAGIVDDLEVRNSARQLEAAYRERGHHFAQVAGSLAAEGDGPVVRFQIQEGPEVTVESVTFSAHRALPDERLRARMETRPPGVLRPGLFRQDVLDRDLLVLLSLYRSEGYPEATVGPADVVFAADRRRARITIPIAEGPGLVVGAITVEGARVFEPREILAAVPLQPGDPWHRQRAEEGQRGVDRLYARRGFLAAEVALETTRREGVVDVRFRVQEGEPTRVGRIVISGLVRTKEHVVRRELPFREGDPVNPEELIEAERRLAALGLFERVTVGPLQPPRTPFADVTLDLRERKPWRLDFGIGFSTDEGARGFVEVGHDNLFGTGRKFSLREKVTRRGDRTDLTYVEPWVLGTRWQGQAGLFREDRSEIGFELERFGGSAALERDLFPRRISGLSGALRYRIESVDRFNVNPTLAAADVVPGRQVIASLTPSLTLDRRDHRLDPRRGSLHRLSLEGAGAPLGSDANFLKASGETHWFFQWLPPTVFALSARVGLATTVGGTRNLPIEDRFFAGGGTTVRGYRDKRVGPLDAGGNPTGGDALVVLNAEWRFPIWRWLGGTLFADTGAVTPEVGDLRNPRFKTGVGAGLRLNSPVGPLRLDFGYALNRIPGEQRWQISFTVGHPF